MFSSEEIFESYRASVRAICEGKPVNEDIGDWLIKKARDARTNIVKDLDDGQFLNVRKNAFKQIMRGQYHKALGKMERYNIKYNSASPNGIKIFRHRFEKLPFVLGAVGYSIYNRNLKSVPDICSTITTIMSEVFGDSLDQALKMKSTETPKYNDIFSFCLTWGAKIEPKWKKYDRKNDVAIIQMLEYLISHGYNPGNILQTAAGFIDYLMRSDDVMAVKYLVENKKLTVSSTMTKTYGLNPASQIAKYLAESGEHPFRLHEPDVVVDKRGRISSDTDGIFASKMSSLGYMISQKDVQNINVSTLNAIKDELAIIIRRYTTQNGEKFSNLSKINIFKGSTFATMQEELRKLIQDYSKMVSDQSFTSLGENEKAQKLNGVAGRLTQILSAMQKSVNPVLQEMQLPPIAFKFSVDTSKGISSTNVVQVMQELGAKPPQQQQQQQTQSQPTNGTTAPQQATQNAAAPAAPQQATQNAAAPAA